MFIKLYFCIYLIYFFIFLADLSFPEEMINRRSGKIKNQEDYEEKILNDYS